MPRLVNFPLLANYVDLLLVHYLWISDSFLVGFWIEGHIPDVPLTLFKKLCKKILFPPQKQMQKPLYE